MSDNVLEIFGSMVFNDKVMKERLSASEYAEVVSARDNGKPLSKACAVAVAEAMKNWAIENGATHYTHWFQPMTGVTAEKHNGFIEPDGKGGAILEFSAKSLVKGESDASSLPSGGLRATFEARGYTAWDFTSYAFIKDGSLYIPTAFCSYGGESLDKKTPLLRSMDALNRQAMRVIRLFGDDKTKRVIPTVGSEQEYFLIDKNVYEKRADLINCGRTLFGARPAKGQELDDHYYGSINARVAEYMKDVDRELWKLGVYAKTKHNEVAPSQHELAPVFVSANIACDQNQLTMEVMKSVAGRHGLVCLLHEKPFKYVNGSGKHNNWSLTTDAGENLLEPGETPENNARFLLFLTAVIKAVDEYQDLLRVSVAGAGNDLRLGENEAPPAIISIYLGSELEGILSAIESGENYNAKKKSELEIGVSVLPAIPKDSTDRNRTSPFAFTGNKFEFRMVGSSENIGCTNFILNTIVAEELSLFADELEKAKDFNAAISDIVKRTVKEHKRILFSGNNYSDEWVKEAEKRGLLNLKTAVDALRLYASEKNVALFEKHGVLTRGEINSRAEILFENYADRVLIEAITATDMAKKELVPSFIAYQGFLLDEIEKKKNMDASLDYTPERETLESLSELSRKFYSALKVLDKAVKGVNKGDSPAVRAEYAKDVLIPDMGKLRAVWDDAELIIGKSFIGFPLYEDLLYSVKD